MMRKKVPLIIIIVFVLLIVGAAFLSNYCRKLNKMEQGNIEHLIKGGEKQALILYQGSISNLVKDQVDCITKILQESDYTITINHPNSELTYNAQDYDVIVLVSPVYARKLAQPILDFADCQDFEGKKVYGVIVGMVKQEGQEAELKSHIKNATKTKVIKVVGFDKTQAKDSLEGLLSE